MAYSPHHHLATLAQPSASLYRLALGIAMLIALTIGLNAAYFVALSALIAPEHWAALAPALARGQTPLSVLIILFSFALIFVALAGALRLVHHRALIGLLGPLPQALRDFGRVFGALILLNLLMWLVPMPQGMELQPNLDPATWRGWLLWGLLGLLIQTSAEELAFRGYLQSQLAARFSHPAIWIIAPSALFGALHYDPSTTGDNALPVAIWAALFGLAAADLTARTGTLGAAIGLHFATNITALLIAAPHGALSGLALYTYPFDVADTAAAALWLPLDALILLCSWLAARLALRR